MHSAEVSLRRSQHLGSVTYDAMTVLSWFALGCAVHINHGLPSTLLYCPLPTTGLTYNSLLPHSSRLALHPVISLVELVG